MTKKILFHFASKKKKVLFKSQKKENVALEKTKNDKYFFEEKNLPKKDIFLIMLDCKI